MVAVKANPLTECVAAYAKTAPLLRPLRAQTTAPVSDFHLGCIRLLPALMCQLCQAQYKRVGRHERRKAGLRYVLEDRTRCADSGHCKVYVANHSSGRNGLETPYFSDCAACLRYTHHRVRGIKTLKYISVPHAQSNGPSMKHRHSGRDIHS